MAVDHAANKHKACHPIVTLDLASDEAVEYLLTLLTQPHRSTSMLRLRVELAAGQEKSGYRASIFAWASKSLNLSLNL